LNFELASPGSLKNSFARKVEEETFGFQFHCVKLTRKLIPIRENRKPKSREISSLRSPILGDPNQINDEIAKIGQKEIKNLKNRSRPTSYWPFKGRKSGFRHLKSDNIFAGCCLDAMKARLKRDER